MRLYMQTPPVAGETLRFYQIILQRDLLGGWSVVRLWGQQGSAGSMKRDHFESLEGAHAFLQQSRDTRAG